MTSSRFQVFRFLKHNFLLVIALSCLAHPNFDVLDPWRTSSRITVLFYLVAWSLEVLTVKSLEKDLLVKRPCCILKTVVAANSRSSITHSRYVFIRLLLIYYSSFSQPVFRTYSRKIHQIITISHWFIGLTPPGIDPNHLRPEFNQKGMESLKTCHTTSIPREEAVITNNKLPRLLLY